MDQKSQIPLNDVCNLPALQPCDQQGEAEPFKSPDGGEPISDPLELGVSI